MPAGGKAATRTRQQPAQLPASLKELSLLGHSVLRIQARRVLPAHDFTALTAGKLRLPG